MWFKIEYNRRLFHPNLSNVIAYVQATSIKEAEWIFMRHQGWKRPVGNVKISKTTAYEALSHPWNILGGVK